MKLHSTLALCVSLWAGAADSVAQTSPTVDPTAFINGGGLEAPSLSPDGTRLAGMLRTNTLRALVTQNIDGSDRKVVFTEDRPEAALDLVRWVSNDRVLLRASKSDGVRLGRQTLPVSRLVSIAIDGTAPKVMAPRDDDRGSINHSSFEGDLACDSSPYVTVRIGALDRGTSDLGRFDARTGAMSDVLGVKGEPVRWWVDSEGHARLVMTRDGGAPTWQWRPSGRGNLAAVDWPVLKGYTAWHLMGFDALPNHVLALAERDGTWQLVRIDVNKPTEAEVLTTIGEVSRPEHATLLRNELTCNAVGVRHGDQTVLWGDNLAPFWAGLVQALPEPKLVLEQWQGDRVLVRLSQASLPTRYLLGLRSARKLDVVAETYRRLPGNLGLTERTFSIGEAKARWLQRADASGALPTVVCIGCEIDRADSAGYNPLSAYFAYRGFGVLSVSDRDAPMPLLEEQAKDVQAHGAALRWADEKGWSDAQRVAIVAGHSNASWMAMALASAQQPPVRAVAVSGLVSDMGRQVFRDILGRTGVSEGTRASYRRLIGTATEAELSAASPMARVAQWQIPLLLIHPEQHGAVDVKHSQMLADAMQAAGKPVTLLRLPKTTEILAHPPYRSQVIKAIDDLLAPLLVKAL